MTDNSRHFQDISESFGFDSKQKQKKFYLNEIKEFCLFFHTKRWDFKVFLALQALKTMTSWMLQKEPLWLIKKEFKFNI